MKAILAEYNAKKAKTLEDIIDLLQRFEAIYPFQDGKVRIVRLVMFKECLANNIVPFIITDDLKFYYYRGLREWNNLKGVLSDNCLTAQEHNKQILDYFEIKHAYPSRHTQPAI